MRKKTRLEKAVFIAMMEHGFTWESLAEAVGHSAASNLHTSIKTGSIRERRFIKMCEVLKLDINEMMKLKLQRHED